MKEKATASLRLAFKQHLGYKTVRTFFDKQCILSAENFHLVWWKGLRAARKDFPKLYWLWLTKQVSEFSGTNRQLAYWNTSVDPRCLDCGGAEENTMHMTRC